MEGYHQEKVIMYKIFILSQKNDLVFDSFDLNKSYSFKDTIKIINKLREQKVMAMFYREDYPAPNITNMKFRIFISSRNNNLVFDFFDLNKSYSIDDAIEIIKKLREQKNAAEFYPEEYTIPQITMEQAMVTAITEYNRAVAKKPGNYGEFQIGIEKPIYYSFYCRDFEAEADGCVPGVLMIYIDKLSGEIMPYSKIRKYLDMNDSF